MAIPAIWRASDNYLISDKCISWSDWGETSGVQENELLIGGIFHMEQLGNPHQGSEAVFIFGDQRPTSTLANLEVLKDCRRNVEAVIFRDQDGNLTTCEIVQDIAVEPYNNRLRRNNKATVMLRPVGSI